MKNIPSFKYTSIIKNTDYIIDHHKVHDISIMPGVTFLDMILRILINEKVNIKGIELKNILFKEAISTTDKFDVKVEIKSYDNKDRDAIIARSQKVKNGNIVDERWIENLNCEVLINDIPDLSPIDFNKIKKESNRVINLEESYDFARKVRIHHYEFMKALGDVYVNDDYILGEIHLSDLAKQFLKSFYIHPVYLDSATLVAILTNYSLFTNNGKSGIDFSNVKTSLPIFIDSFKVYNTITDNSYVLIRRKDNIVLTEDLTYMDLEIYNEKGEIAALFKRFTTKQIRSPELINPQKTVPVINMANKKNEHPIPERKNNDDNVSGNSTLKKIEDELVNMVSEILDEKPDKINMEEGFYDMGLDSRQLLQIVQTLENKKGLQLYPTLLFEYTNIKELASYLHKEYGNKYSEKETVVKGKNIGNEINSILYFTDKWERKDLNEIKNDINTIIVFDFDEGMYDKIREKKTGRNIILVKPGKEFMKISDCIYSMNPLLFEDHKKFIENIENLFGLPDIIIYLWAKNDFEKDNAEIGDKLNSGIYNIFYLTRILAEKKITNNIQIIYSFFSSKESPQPQNSSIIGFAKSIFIENPKLCCKTIDFQFNREYQSKYADLIISEITDDFYPVEIRYDEFGRWIKSHVPLKSSVSASIEIPPIPLKDNGVYIITGGAGGLGLIFAEYITSKVKAKIILSGRSQLTVEKENKIRSIQHDGSEITYIASDISQPENLTKMIADIKVKYEHIDGIIHCAGIIKDNMVFKMDKSSLEEVINPKVLGTINLDKVTKNERLDFFVLFSSLSAVIGNAGQSAYAYGNCFMDFYAQFREEEVRQNKCSGRTISINWPFWDDGGMKLDDGSKEQIYNMTGIAPLSVQDGIKSFEMAFCFPYPQFIVACGNSIKINKIFNIQSAKEEEIKHFINKEKKDNQINYVIDDKKAAFNERTTDIAVIGISGRYPLSKNIYQFWNNLKNARDCITEIPEDRWDYKKYYDPDKSKIGKTYSKWGGFISDVDKFDCMFFNITPREALNMDPQERLFLETVWQTIEDAGYTRKTLGTNKIGVYVGVMWGQYQLFRKEMDGAIISGASFYASIANRISSFFNFHGPSLALDTMCSSSLTTIHLACESLIGSGIEMAIAGGINLSIDPGKYSQLCAEKFLSSDGRCRSFGEGGDGYVPGEGVGALLLKPLKKALSDRDYIYGIIKGSSINHGGKTSGYTVPHPVSQSELILDVLEKTNINPETISFLEAHGTGTSLGDPIEIQGLTRSFGKYTDKKQFCPIGSVKSNIGHLESASGIASVTKVLLQMKHKHLVPSLHSDVPNSNINFENSPFYLQHKYQKWEKSISPRRSGISSFGAGGANAHIIIEEYDNDEYMDKSDVSQRQIIVLSARTEKNLKLYAKDFLFFLDLYEEENKNTSVRLCDMAYTLQTGRESMDYRMAVVVSNMSDLKNVLNQYCDDNKNIPNVYYGNVREEKDKIKLLIEGKTGEQFLKNIIEDNNFEKISQLWIMGADIDWDLLHSSYIPHRIPLPAYPFQGDRYWIDDYLKSQDDNVSAGTETLSPLIHKNISTLKKEIFLSNIKGTEYFLTDHKINSKKVLPGAVYIEMICESGKEALERNVSIIRNIRWIKPAVFEDLPRNIYVQFYPVNKDVDYKIISRDDMGNEHVHSDGLIITDERSSKNNLTERIDIGAILKRCDKIAKSSECYQLFALQGLEYGPGFRTIQEISYNNNEAIGCIKLPEKLNTDFNKYILHPSLLDGAFQTVINLMGDIDNNTHYLPFSIDELEIIEPLKETCFVWVTSIAGKNLDDGSMKKWNILIADETGLILVRINNFCIKSIQSNFIMPQGLSSTLSYYHRTWEKTLNAEDTMNYDDSLILLFDDTEYVRDCLTDKINKQLKRKNTFIIIRQGNRFIDKGNDVYEIDPGSIDDYERLLDDVVSKYSLPDVIIHLWSQIEENRGMVQGLNDDLINGFFSLFYISKILIKKGINKKIKIFYMTLLDESKPQFLGVSGLIKTIRIENPDIDCRYIETGDKTGIKSATVSAILQEMDLQNCDTPEIRYTDRHRYVRKINEIEKTANLELPGDTGLHIKENGVYLITGGFGGLGCIFAEYIAGFSKSKIVLAGRSELDGKKSEKIKNMSGNGSEIIYIRADVSNHEDVKRLVDAIIKQFGRIDGIIHSSGVLRDSFILKKTKKEIDDVLSSKVFGTVYLDEATKDLDLDFFVLFSSLASVLGNTGQCDYTYANAFMDNFAVYREKLNRRGRSLSINWPLWQNGGMNLNNESVKLMGEMMGITPLSTENGIIAFNTCMNLKGHQIIVIEGNKDKLDSWITNNSNVNKSVMKQPVTDFGGIKKNIDVTDDVLLEKTVSILKEMLFTTTKIPPEEINVNDSFEKFGINSLMIMELTAKLEIKFGSLSKTLFFEYQTIDKLAAYFVKNFKSKLISTETRSGSDFLHFNRSSNGNISEINYNRRFTDDLDEIHNFSDVQHSNDDGIAIVGISGRYPMASSLEVFWENLKNKMDCITEIPPDRWNYGDFFDNEKNQINKTYSKWGGFLEDIDKFDPFFFNIQPREAEIMDPQERIFLETVWEAIEDAGYTKDDLSAKSIGVFVGVMYGQYQLLKGKMGEEDFSPLTLFASIANRVSYFFDFKGPSIALDTMCSSSLTAIHLACESIRTGDCDFAIAGGVNLSLHPNKYNQLSLQHFLSTDGRCRSFGKGGDGYVPGEGAGVIFLKPLNKAITDRDNIYAIIKGSMLNHGGKTNGYTVPNPVSQEQLILKVIKKLNLNPEYINYIEAHGTGTSLGDPIEITSLSNAFNKYTDKIQFCPIGSVKSNIGHLESASGIAGITKVLLQMKHKQIVPSLHSKELNPNINFSSTPFYVQQDLTSWNRIAIEENGIKKTIPRTAGVSSFGAGGSNAFVILQEYDSSGNDGQTADDGEKIILLSAKSRDRLKCYAEIMLEFLKNNKSNISREENKINDGKFLQSLYENAKNILSSIINVDHKLIDLDYYLSDYGMDVITYNSFIQKMIELCNSDISIANISEYPTLRKLIDYLYDNNEHNHEKNGDESEHKEKIFFNNFTYTLQTGRTAFEERLAFTASSIKETVEKLEDFLNNDFAAEKIYVGNIKKAKIPENLNEEMKNGRNYVEKLMKKKELEKIIELWINSVPVNWRLLYNGNPPWRISIPHYPFEKEKCWLPGVESGIKNNELKEKKIKIPANDNVTYHEKENIKHSSIINDGEIVERLVEYLKELLAFAIKTGSSRIDPDNDFSEYGIDSVVILGLNEVLEKNFGELSSTLFFKYKSIRSLARYLAENYSNESRKLLSSIPGNNLELPGIEKNVPKDLKNNMKFMQSSKLQEDDIAIIGLSCQSPMAGDQNEFWQNLKSGKDCITEIPADRWDYHKYYDEDDIKKSKIYCKWGGFLDDIDKFDPQFFNIAPSDAYFIDPHERLILQDVWHCLEDAGYTKKTLANPDAGDNRAPVGVFIGVTFNNYQLIAAHDWNNGILLPVNSQLFSIANRISYYFNFSGPSMPVDTACSSSLYALQLACKSIYNGECEMAIAGGVNLSLHQSKYFSLCATQFLAMDGRCRSFAEGGKGYVPSEGVGSVFLKPLRKAIKDHDNIYAVIKGSAINHDGKTHGFTVPNPVAQTEVILKALDNSGINPRTISYIEAHGTGTSLGDPIEITGLNDAFKAYSQDNQYCHIGSVKSNIGHSEAAAGIEQLAKVLLQMRYKEFVPTIIHGEKLNSKIDFMKTPFIVQRSNQEWKQPVIKEGEDSLTLPRRAGISSFGAGGVNVHVILEEYIPSEEDAPLKSPITEEKRSIIPVSAKSFESLKEYLKKLYDMLNKRRHENLNKPNDFSIQNIAYSLQIGREIMPYRIAFLVHSIDDLCNKLKLCNENDLLTDLNDELIYQGPYKVIMESGVPPDIVKIDKKDLELLFENNQYDMLGKNWVCGHDFDWHQLYKKLKDLPYKISLPGYYFNKQRYWIPTAEEISLLMKTDENISQDDSCGEDSLSSDILVKLLDSSEAERYEILIEYLQKTIARILDFKPPNIPSVKQGFFDMGAESVQAIQFQNAIEKTFNVKLSDTAAFDYPNILDFASYLLALLDFNKIENSFLKNKSDNISDHESLSELNNIHTDTGLFTKEPLPDDIDNMTLEEVIDNLKNEL